MLIAEITWMRTQNPSHRKPNSQNIPKWSRNDRAVADNASLFCFLSLSIPVQTFEDVASCTKTQALLLLWGRGRCLQCSPEKELAMRQLSDSRSITTPNCWTVCQRSLAGPVGVVKRRGKSRSREKEVLPVPLL